MNLHELEQELIEDEGFRNTPYKCSKGHWTIGVGHKMAPREMDIKSLGDEAVWNIFRHDIRLAIRGCEMIFGRSKFYLFSEIRQRALVNMCFQLGTDGLSKFQRMIQSIFQEDWQQAYIEALDSKWAKKDTPVRARRVAEMIRTGVERKDVKA